MTFQTFHPYDDNFTDNNDNTDTNCNECFICFENNIDLLTLKTQCIYIKYCECDGFVHEECLDRWFQNTNQCPICRINMVKFDVYYIHFIIHNENYYILYFIFTTIKNTLLLINRFFMTITIIYLIYQLYRLPITSSFCIENIHGNSSLSRINENWCKYNITSHHIL